MTLKEIIDHIWEKENISEKILIWNANKDIQAYPFIEEDIKEALYQPKYTLRHIIPASKSRELSKLLCPEAHENTKVRNAMLLKYGYKFCLKCNSVHQVSYFSKNKNRDDGLNSNCKTCQKADTARTQPSRQIKYKSAKIQRTPEWSELELITQFYRNCPKDWHVDHIIPLQGEIVCGLHVLENLQYLPARENESKNNKFEGITITY